MRDAGPFALSGLGLEAIATERLPPDIKIYASFRAFGVKYVTSPVLSSTPKMNCPEGVGRTSTTVPIVRGVATLSPGLENVLVMAKILQCSRAGASARHSCEHQLVPSRWLEPRG